MRLGDIMLEVWVSTGLYWASFVLAVLFILICLTACQVPLR
jgi:hypothetical protein